MFCPRDTAVLTLEALHDVDAYVCARCRGVAFQGEALARLLEAPVSLEGVRKRFAEVHTPPGLLPQVHTYSEERFSCPEGHGAMRRYCFGGNAKFFVDACTHCEVVWIDGWEVRELVAFVQPNLTEEKLIRAFAEEANGTREEQAELTSILHTLTQIPTSPLMLVKLAVILAPIFLKSLLKDGECVEQAT